MSEHESTLFDLKTQEVSSQFGAVNHQLRIYRPEYLKRFGEVGSPEWWAHYDAGHLSRTFIVGEVTFVGHRPLGTETEDVVSILTDNRTLEYDRDGFWLSDRVRPGAWVTIERVKTVCKTPNGPLMNLIDIRITCESERPTHPK